jgi:hypothetical protein
LCEPRVGEERESVDVQERLDSSAMKIPVEKPRNEKDEDGENRERERGKKRTRANEKVKYQ